MGKHRPGARPALAGLGMALLLALAPAHPAMAETGQEIPDLILEDRGQAPALLVPGSTSRWVLGVTTKGVKPSGLSLRLSAAGPLADATNGTEHLLTVQLSACPGAWTAGKCADGGRTIIPPTPLASLDGTVRSLATPDGGIPAGVELLAAVTLSPAAGNAVQGLSATLTARVDAAGEPLAQAPDGGRPPGGNPPVGALPDGNLPDGDLPDTGVRLGGLALLGAAAVAAGMAAAGWARRKART
jgi:hypothetical protein